MSTAKKEEEPNPYELLQVPLEATEAQVRTAYRTRSLKVHPDRNPDDPDAAKKFHVLNQAYSLLLDPLRRLALDAQLRILAARKERFSTYDKKRAALVTELEEREREVKRSRVDKQQVEKRRETENERIRDMGRKMREDREKAMKDKGEELKRESQMAEEDAPPALGSLDLTVRVKYTLAAYPTLDAPAALAAYFSHFGPIETDTVILSSKPAKQKKKGKPQKPDMPSPNNVTALVPFTQLSGAYAAVSASGKDKLYDIAVAWAGGEEPPILGWLRKNGQLGTSTQERNSASRSSEGSPFGPPKSSENSGSTPTSTHSAYTSFPSIFPSFSTEASPLSIPTAPVLDYESLTLLRMREAERARLEREILEAEAQE